MRSYHEIATDKKLSYYIFISVIILASFLYLFRLDTLPLNDYDEATYAQVTRDTLASENLLTLSYFSEPWFEKPPLYFWSAMVTTRVFGQTEFAYRLPSALMAIVVIAMLWLLVRRLTGDTISATLASLILIASPFFFITARQVRLDIPVIAMILFAVTAFIYGWKRPWLLALVAPAIALGFLFKSVIALIALLVILIFSIVYRKFRWLRSGWFWAGVLGALVILVPWHWYQYQQFGSSFVSQYIGFHIIDRYTEGVGSTAGLQHIRYFKLLAEYGQPWISLFAASLIFFVWHLSRKRDSSDFFVIASLISAVAIYLLFSFGKTSILTYLLPMFPFIAIVVGVFVIFLFNRFRQPLARVFVSLVLIALIGYSYTISSGLNPNTLDTLYYPWSQYQKEIGLLVKEGSTAETTFYIFEWPTNEAFRFYSGKELHFIGFPPPQGTVLQGPWFLFLTNTQVPIFLDEEGIVKPEYEQLEIKYGNDMGQLFLFYSEEDLAL